MNLHAIVSGAIGAVNPHIPAVLKVSAGYTEDAEGKQVPSYAADARITAQVQPLTGGNLRQLENLNLQGNFVGIYCDGEIEGLVRAKETGGDLIIINSGVNAGTWLVALVLEQWPDWVKVAATLQDAS